MSSTKPHVRLEQFEGPLDLLLQLIERRELDVTVISLARVADDYLVTVRAMQAPDAQALADFIALAARLLLIKSRALLPRPPVSAEQEQLDDAEALARQLREYQRYKAAAAQLRSWDEQGRRSFLRTAAPPRLATTPVAASYRVAELLAALQKRLQLQLPELPPPVPLPTPRILTIGQVSHELRTRLRQQDWLGFRTLLPRELNRAAVIVTLWTVLEMLKRREITAQQPELFGEITLGRGEAFDTQARLDEPDEVVA